MAVRGRGTDRHADFCLLLQDGRAQGCRGSESKAATSKVHDEQVTILGYLDRFYCRYSNAECEEYCISARIEERL